MKKTILVLCLIFIGIAGFSQNIFEAFIEPDDNNMREANLVVETKNHGFIIGCEPDIRTWQNDMLVKLSAEGEIERQLNILIGDKKVKYCGLYRHPESDDEYLAVATLFTGNTNDEYVENELAIIVFDSELNIVNQTIHGFGDDYVSLSGSYHNRPRFILEDNGTIIMISHCLKTDGYCYLFASFTTGGELLSINESNALSSVNDDIHNTFSKRRPDKSFGMISTGMEGGDGGEFYYEVDSLFNITRIGWLNNLNIRVVQTNPQYADTIYKYYYPGGGTTEYLNDSVFLVTTGGRFMQNVYGSSIGYFHFISLMKDSLEIVDNRIWDIRPKMSNFRTNTLPAQYKAISITDEAVYHCGITGMRQHYMLTMLQPMATTIVVSKFDKEMNLIWRRYYGANGNFYDIDCIKATEDGGCIITGMTAKSSNLYKLYAYAMKIDEDGYNSTDENEATAGKPYFCYPNPASDKLFVEFSPDVQCQSLEILTLDGKLVKSLSSTIETIDISDLNSGVYFVKLRMSDGLEFIEKIVKE